MALTNDGLLKSIADLLKQELEPVKLDVSNIKQDITEMKADIKNSESRIKNIELTLENEVLKGINIIGEGHSNLNRRLEEAVSVSRETEIFQLRVLNLERQMREIRRV